MVRNGSNLVTQVAKRLSENAENLNEVETFVLLWR